jgi:dTDP-4-dehydrorhamnose reductase
MVTKRILLFGGNGQVGRALQNQNIPSDWHLIAPPRGECDFTRRGDIVRTIRAHAPDLVINAAAMADIDACQSNRELAMMINFNSVSEMTSVCVECDAPLIHISTDYVFDGKDGDIPYLPDSPMNPLNAYGESKLMGEEAVRHGSYGHVIVRTSLVFGAYGENVLTKILRQIDTQDDVQAVLDQIANPTGAGSLARGLIKIADTVLSGKAHCFGTFHLCGEPAVSRYAFAQAVMAAYAPFIERRPRLSGVASADLPDRVPRPGYSALNCDKTLAVYGIRPTPWREELATAIKQLRPAIIPPV